MQNSSIQEPAEHGLIDPSSRTLIPQSDHGLPLVTPSCNPTFTAITPTHTPVMPPAHTNLSRKQAQVLELLGKIVSRQTSYSIIGIELGLSKSAARDAVSALVIKEYISSLATIRDGVFQGFTYKIDSPKYHRFLETGGVNNSKYFTANYTITPHPQTVCPPSYPLHTHSSSKVFNLENKLTTKAVDLAEPEMLWWVDQGLTTKQIEVWIDQFRMVPEDLSQALRFARFDIVEIRNKSLAEPIDKPMNWFFITLKKSGYYPRPQNYKSAIELRAEALEEQQRRDEIARKKIFDAEIEIRFREFMSNKELPPFLELFASVDDFAKEDQFALDIAMKELFKKKYSMELWTPNCFI